MVFEDLNCKKDSPKEQGAERLAKLLSALLTPMIAATQQFVVEWIS